MYLFDFWPGHHIWEALGQRERTGSWINAMRKESEVKAAVFVAGKMDGGCRKQSLLGARE